MKLVVIAMVGWLLLTTPSAAKAQGPQPQPGVVELKAPDGTFLKVLVVDFPRFCWLKHEEDDEEPTTVPTHPASVFHAPVTAAKDLCYW
jgi:hypothetical protein